MLALTPEILEASYNYLAATEPFCKWNLPHGEDVTFRVTRSRACLGRAISNGDDYEIEISQRAIGHTTSLMMLMAHEMLHIHQFRNGMDIGNTVHNAAFHADARIICRIHGFDPCLF